MFLMIALQLGRSSDDVLDIICLAGDVDVGTILTSVVSPHLLKSHSCGIYRNRFAGLFSAIFGELYHGRLLHL
jgi:hypothetical protein